MSRFLSSSKVYIFKLQLSQKNNYFLSLKHCKTSLVTMTQQRRNNNNRNFKNNNNSNNNIVTKRINNTGNNVPTGSNGISNLVTPKSNYSSRTTKTTLSQLTEDRFDDLPISTSLKK
eukprot:Awhi_evm1s13511